MAPLHLSNPTPTMSRPGPLRLSTPKTWRDTTVTTVLRPAPTHESALRDPQRLNVLAFSFTTNMDNNVQVCARTGWLSDRSAPPVASLASTHRLLVTRWLVSVTSGCGDENNTQDVSNLHRLHVTQDNTPQIIPHAPLPNPTLPYPTLHHPYPTLPHFALNPALRFCFVMRTLGHGHTGLPRPCPMLLPCKANLVLSFYNVSTRECRHVSFEFLYTGQDSLRSPSSGAENSHCKDNSADESVDSP